MCQIARLLAYATLILRFRLREVKEAPFSVRAKDRRAVIPFTSSTAKKNSLSSYIPSRTKPRHSLPQRELTCSRPAPIYVRTGHGKKPIQWYDRR